MRLPEANGGGCGLLRGRRGHDAGVWGRGRRSWARGSVELGDEPLRLGRHAVEDDLGDDLQLLEWPATIGVRWGMEELLSSGLNREEKVAGRWSLARPVEDGDLRQGSSGSWIERGHAGRMDPKGYTGWVAAEITEMVGGSRLAGFLDRERSQGGRRGVGWLLEEKDGGCRAAAAEGFGGWMGQG